jgi:phosphate transport system protein
MRDLFHEELDAIAADHLRMTSLIRDAIESATQALLGADLKLAEKVIADDLLVDQIANSLDERTINLMARQQPVASDLRSLVSSLRISSDLERMGDLAHHIAKLARMRFPNKAVPGVLEDLIREMGSAATKMVEKMAVVIEFRDLNRAIDIDTDDDEMDALQRKLIGILLSDDWGNSVESAVDMAFASRYYERFADHAVSVGRRVYFTETGEYPAKK